jgi:hypothetical protein
MGKGSTKRCALIVQDGIVKRRLRNPSHSFCDGLYDFVLLPLHGSWQR